jgi:anti-sigma factor RsiW
MVNGLENWAINAYADGELDAAERAAVEKQLADNPDARRVLENFQRQKAALHAAYDSVLGEAVPHSLQRTVQGGGTRRLGPYAAMAASLAMLAIGGSIGWFAARNTEGTPVFDLARRAIVAHEVYSVEVKHPVEVPASDSEHLQAWLSKRVGSPFKIPDLSSHGFALIGGRLLAAEDRPAGQLMFENATKERITIFVSSNTGQAEQALQVREVGKHISCYWQDGPLSVAVTADLPRDEMMTIANHIYAQLEES